MAGVLTWIRRWWTGDGASRPGTAVPEPASPEGQGGSADPSDPPAPAAEPAPAPASFELASPRDVLPDRPPTLNDLALFLLHSILGSTRALFRFLAVLVVIGAVLAWRDVPADIHALSHLLAPASGPALHAVRASWLWLGGVGALAVGYRRIRARRAGRAQEPSGGTAPSPAPGTAVPPQPDPPAAESDVRQP
ncbi:hypothetical protein ACWCV9_10515 [Streptomyces sp. NPDC001606]